MPRRCFCRIPVLIGIFILALSFLLIACTPEIKKDETDIASSGLFGGIDNKLKSTADIFTEGLDLPQQEKNIKWNESEEDSVFTLDAGYKGVSLRYMLLLMQSLNEKKWYLTENKAYKGSRSLTIDYDLETQKLHLIFEKNKLQKEWPDVLPPYLDYATPVFTYGHYKTYEKRELPNCENAIMLVYTRVNRDDLKEYEKTLISAGYIFDAEVNGQRFLKKNTLFVSLAGNDQNNEAAIIVGNYKVYPVPLPPWPDPFPEYIKRILSPVAAICTVQDAEDGFFAKADGLTLSELYLFYTAMSKGYGWSEILDTGEIRHNETGFVLKALSFNTGENIFTFTMYNDLNSGGTQTPTQTASQTPSPSDTYRDEGFDDGLPDFDFALTEGYYTEKEAMDGILNEFGQTVEMANWDEIKSLYADRFDLFLNSVGVKGNEDVWLLHDKSGFDGNRHYFLARISGKPRENFKLYDKVGNEAWLGSWYGIKLRIMVKKPAS